MVLFKGLPSVAETFEPLALHARTTANKAFRFHQAKLKPQPVADAFLKAVEPDLAVVSETNRRLKFAHGGKLMRAVGHN